MQDVINTTSDKSKPVDKLIELGANMVGGVAGAAVGFFTGGPAGALIGAASGPALAHAVREIGGDLYNRHLSKREMARIGAVMFYAAERFRENIENGQRIRQDDFFQEQPEERSTAEEIIEGTLIAAQREHEEKKLQYYGNLLANIAFHLEIDRYQANLLISLGQSISYRQMCLLALFYRKREFKLRKGTYGELIQDAEKGRSEGTTLIALLQEVDDLVSKRLVDSLGYTVGHTLTSVNPAMTDVQGMGATLHNLMELWKIDVQELNAIAKLLQ